MVHPVPSPATRGRDREGAETSSFYLLGDIGGTNSRFALCHSGTHAPLHQMQYPNDRFNGLEAAIRHYLQEQGNPHVEAACIAVACPVTGDRVQLTNRDWQFSQSQLAGALGVRLRVVNDYGALAMSLPHLPADAVRKIGGGEARLHHTIGLLGAGTGLGVAGLAWGEGQWHPLSGEGGHVAIAPCNEAEIAILRIGWRRYDGFVSAERILSGEGIAFLYEALAEIHGWAEPTLTPEEISRRALEAGDAACQQVLTQFCAFMGTVASDLALTLGAFGGIYIGGGIIPRLGSFFDAPFRERFEAKGRFAGYVSGIPTLLLKPDMQPALYGCAAFLGENTSC
jgi:glucokinase